MNTLHLFVFKHALPLVAGSRNFLIYSVEPVVYSRNFHLKLYSVIHKNSIELLDLRQNFNGPHIEFQLLDVCWSLHHILFNLLNVGPRKWVQASEVIGGHSHHRFVQELVVNERPTLIVRHLFYLAKAIPNFDLKLLKFTLPRILHARKCFRLCFEFVHNGLNLSFYISQRVDFAHFGLENPGVPGAHTYSWKNCTL